MGNKAHSAVVEPKIVVEKLTQSSIDTAAGHFSLAGATPSSTTPGTLELSKKSFLVHMAPYLDETSWPKIMLERLFAVADLNNSGSFLKFEDYISLLYVIGPTGTKEEKLQLIFRLYDWDASGYITKKSMAKMMSISTGMNQVTSSWKVMVTKYDRYEGTLFENIEKLSKSDLSSISDPMVDTAMSFYDKDKDGKLNYEEWCNFALDSVEIDVLIQTWESPLRHDSPWSGMSIKAKKDENVACIKHQSNNSRNW